MLASAKLDKHFDYPSHVDWYMQKYRTPVWRAYRNDEFALHEKREETEKIFRERVEALDLNKPFLLRARVTFGQYDFKENRFPITTSGPDSYWYERDYQSGDFPSKFRVYLENHEAIKYVFVDQATAKYLVQGRKDRYGNVNRNVYLNMQLLIQRRESDGRLIAKVKQAQFFADSGRTHLLHAFVLNEQTDSSDTNPTEKSGS